MDLDIDPNRGTHHGIDVLGSFSKSKGVGSICCLNVPGQTESSRRVAGKPGPTRKTPGARMKKHESPFKKLVPAGGLLIGVAVVSWFLSFSAPSSGPSTPRTEGEVLASIKLHTRTIPRQLRFIDGGIRLAVSDRSVDRLILWKGPEWKLDHELRVSGSLLSFSISSDSRWLAVVKSGGRVELHALSTSLRSLEAPVSALELDKEGLDASITSALAFSPQGGLFAIGMRMAGKSAAPHEETNVVRVFRIGQQTPLLSFQPANDRELRAPEVYGLEFSPNGRLLAVGDRDGWLRLFSVADGRLVREFGVPGLGGRAHHGFVTFARFSADGRLLASGDGRSEPVVRVWEIESGMLIREMRLTDDPIDQIQGLDFSPDGSLLIASSIFKVELFETKGWNSVWSVSKDRGSGGFAWATIASNGDFAYVDYPGTRGLGEFEASIQVRSGK